mgnify:CR=1 FL=1
MVAKRRSVPSPLLKAAVLNAFAVVCWLGTGLLVPPSTEAETSAPGRYVYFTLQIGAGFPGGVDGRFEEVGTSLKTELDGNAGFNGETGLGYKVGDFRGDVTFGYSNFSGVRQTLSASGIGSATLDASGDLRLFTAMLNGYYDIPIRAADGTRSRWSPYLGAGIGYGNLSIPDCSFSSDCYEGGSLSGFAYQGKVGVSYRATERGFAFLEGSYLGMTGSELNGVDYDNFGSWRVNVGWRQGFGGAPQAAKVVETAPAVEPAPAPVVQPEPAPTPEPAPSQPIRGLW